MYGSVCMGVGACDSASQLRVWLRRVGWSPDLGDPSHGAAGGRSPLGPGSGRPLVPRAARVSMCRAGRPLARSPAARSAPAMAAAAQPGRPQPGEPGGGALCQGAMGRSSPRAPPGRAGAGGARLRALRGCGLSAPGRRGAGAPAGPRSRG